MGNYWILAPIAGLAVTIIFWKHLFIIPNVKLDWNTLKTLLRDETGVQKIDLSDEDEYPGAIVQMQFRQGNDSVKYIRFHRKGRTDETIDVIRRGAAGFIVTFTDELPCKYTRIGGLTINNPSFPPDVQTVLLGLLHRVRAYAGA